MSDTFVQKFESNPVLRSRGFSYLYFGLLNNWEGRSVYHPQVIRKGDKYFMFYTGTTSIKLLSYHHDIGLAVSNDLKNWERYQKQPIFSRGISGEWNEDLVAHSFIFEEKGKYYMYYDGSPKGIWHEEIGLAVSDDLINWKRSGTTSVLKSGQYWWNRDHVSRCCVFGDNGEYYMFFAGHDGHCERIGLAVSRDLISWENAGKESVLDLGESGAWDAFHVADPRVMKIGDLYLMFYTGYDAKDKKGRLGLAYSRDLIHWERFKYNPIMDVGENSAWDCREAARASIFEDEGEYYIFYSGLRRWSYKTGMATLDMKKIIQVINRNS